MFTETLFVMIQNLETTKASVHLRNSSNPHSAIFFRKVTKYPINMDKFLSESHTEEFILSFICHSKKCNPIYGDKRQISASLETELRINRSGETLQVINTLS